MMTTNRVSLLGNVTKTPAVKIFDNGGKVAQFQIATNERGFTTKSGIEVPAKTQFHNIVVKGGLVNVIEKYVDKGTKLSVIGILRYRDYESSEGYKRTISEIHIKEVEILGRNNGSKRVEQPEEVESIEQKVVFTASEDEDLPF